MRAEWMLDAEVPATVRIDPSQFMLTKDNHRLLSAPVLTDVAAVVTSETVIPRTPEMNDIPEHVQNVEPVLPYSRCVLTERPEHRCSASIAYIILYYW